MDAKTKALLLIATDIKIREFLTKKDPMALKQIEKALGKNRPTPETHPQTFEFAETWKIANSLWILEEQT